jgi:hypothetical protein
VDVGDAEAFSLENGAAQLRSEFPDVVLHRYDDSLVVTESEPLLAYILSCAQAQRTLRALEQVDRENRVVILRALIDEQLFADGQVTITKDSGLFIAQCS